MLSSAWKTVGFAFDIIQVWKGNIFQCSIKGGKEKE